MVVGQEQSIEQRLDELEREFQAWQNRVRWRTVVLLVMIALLGLHGWWHTALTQRLLKQNEALYTVFDSNPIINLTPKTFDPRDFGDAIQSLVMPASLPPWP